MDCDSCIWASCEQWIATTRAYGQTECWKHRLQQKSKEEMRENDEKDDSGGSDDNTTTIEFTNPTVQFSQLFDLISPVNVRKQPWSSGLGWRDSACGLQYIFVVV